MTCFHKYTHTRFYQILNRYCHVTCHTNIFKYQISFAYRLIPIFNYFDILYTLLNPRWLLELDDFFIATRFLIRKRPCKLKEKTVKPQIL